MTPGDPAVTRVPPDAVWPWRHAWLRAHQAPSAVRFDGDSQGIHLSISTDTGVLAIGTALPQPWPDDAVAAGTHWRLRGMAVHPDHRNRGVGSDLLRSMMEQLRTGGAQLVWCNARSPAVPFYLRHGFERIGAEFDLPPIGPHYRMRRRL